jgi:hypothetical protein
LKRHFNNSSQWSSGGSSSCIWLNEVKKRLHDGTDEILEAYFNDMALIWKNDMRFHHRRDTSEKTSEGAEKRSLHKMNKLQKTPDEEY